MARSHRQPYVYIAVCAVRRCAGAGEHFQLNPFGGRARPPRAPAGLGPGAAFALGLATGYRLRGAGLLYHAAPIYTLTRGRYLRQHDRQCVNAYVFLWGPY